MEKKNTSFLRHSAVRLETFHEKEGPYKQQNRRTPEALDLYLITCYNCFNNPSRAIKFDRNRACTKRTRSQKIVKGTSRTWITKTPK